MPGSGSGNQSELETETHLFRDGQEIYAGKPTPLAKQGQADPGRLVVGGSMKLGSGIARGDYVLQVVVTDKLASERYRTATQAIDFEVR